MTAFWSHDLARQIGLLILPKPCNQNLKYLTNYEENYLIPEIPHKADREGLKFTTHISPLKMGNFIFAGLQNTVISSNEAGTFSYSFGYTLSKKIFKILHIGSEVLYERVKDTIKDDYISQHSSSLVSDTLPYKDNTLYKVLADVRFIGIKNLTAAVKVRQTYNQRLFDNTKNIFSREIFKISYDYNLSFLEALTLTPQFKFEKGQNLFYNTDAMIIKVTDDDVILDQSEDMIMKALIFKVRYNISDDIYLISGAESRMLNDFIRPENSSEKTVYTIQFVVKGTPNLFRSSRPKVPIAFTAGYQYTQELLLQSDIQNEENSYFAKFLVAF